MGYTAEHIRATEIIDELFGYGIIEDSVDKTRDTVQMFIDSIGQPNSTRNGDGWTGYEWNRIQQFKGQQRFNLIIVDFGGEYRYIVKM